MSGRQAVDLFVIGGGINGCGIARDAAGRGLSVTLAEMGDLGSATSSASTKLFHGGLRYLEYYEFRLVREALREREVLLAACPHISRPMRFVLPHLKGTRPAWLVRAGLFLYDHMGGHHTLPRTRRIDLVRDPAGVALKPGVRRAFEYSDGWVDDARLVVLNARDAAARGATILTRARVTKARVRDDGLWHVTVRTAGGEEVHRARALVNASGPWVAQVIEGVLRRQPREHIRLVRGSHIVVPKLFDHDRSYFLQGHDKRIIFAIPYEDDFTLIGTTDKDHEGPPETARCTEEERNYLCALASEYFVKAVRPGDVVWSFSGVRPLYDDGAISATAATRDYVLSLETQGAPLLNVFGGKITTYRRLAEAALAKLVPVLPMTGGPWTAGTPLPGGDFPIDGFAHQLALLRARYPFLTQPWARRLLRSYGTEVPAILGTAQSTAELGRAFGATLTEAELRWLFSREYARTAEDVVWRRSKLGLRMTAEEIAAVGRWLEEEARATHSGAGSGNDIEPRDRL